jgi:hypothetical protein
VPEHRLKISCTKHKEFAGSDPIVTQLMLQDLAESVQFLLWFDMMWNYFKTERKKTSHLCLAFSFLLTRRFTIFPRNLQPDS